MIIKWFLILQKIHEKGERKKRKKILSDFSTVQVFWHETKKYTYACKKKCIGISAKNASLLKPKRGITQIPPHVLLCVATYL